MYIKVLKCIVKIKVNIEVSKCCCERAEELVKVKANIEVSKCCCERAEEQVKVKVDIKVLKCLVNVTQT